ncbi:MAG TPA: hypothetical protein VFF30_06025 [Nitrososphaerales archaeon]|nr:hypothetical protein [Nitrososphaerales archaeon]
MSQGNAPCKAKDCKGQFELIPPDNEHLEASPTKKDETSVPKYYTCNSKAHHFNIIYWSKGTNVKQQ